MCQVVNMLLLQLENRPPIVYPFNVSIARYNTCTGTTLNKARKILEGLLTLVLPILISHICHHARYLTLSQLSFTSDFLFLLYITIDTTVYISQYCTGSS